MLAHDTWRLRFACTCFLLNVLFLLLVFYLESHRPERRAREGKHRVPHELHHPPHLFAVFTIASLDRLALRTLTERKEQRR